MEFCGRSYLGSVLHDTTFGHLFVAMGSFGDRLNPNNKSAFG